MTKLKFQRRKGEPLGGYHVSSAVTEIVVGTVYRSRVIPGGWVSYSVEGQEIGADYGSREEAGRAAFDNYCKFAS